MKSFYYIIVKIMYEEALKQAREFKLEKELWLAPIYFDIFNLCVIYHMNIIHEIHVYTDFFDMPVYSSKDNEYKILNLVKSVLRELFPKFRGKINHDRDCEQEFFYYVHSNPSCIREDLVRIIERLHLEMDNILHINFPRLIDLVHNKLNNRGLDFLQDLALYQKNHDYEQTLSLIKILKDTDFKLKTYIL